MSTRFVLAVVLGGVVLFVWQALAWMVMPWSSASLLAFGSESAVQQVVLANAPASGTYFLPQAEEAMAAGEPMIFAAVRRQGHSMGLAMGGQLVVNILALSIAMLLLARAVPLSYAGRVLFIAAIGVTGWLIISASHFLWWGLSAAFVGAELLNTAIGWTLAGLVVAWLLTPRAKRVVPPASTEKQAV